MKKQLSLTNEIAHRLIRGNPLMKVKTKENVLKVIDEDDRKYEVKIKEIK